jgi:hypothetical protein
MIGTKNSSGKWAAAALVFLCFIADQQIKRPLSIRKKISLLFLFLSLLTSVQAQDCNCTTHITSSTSTSYTISAGQVLCVDSGVVFSGVAVIKGGVLCVTGTFNGPITDGTTSGIGTYDNGSTLIINKYGAVYNYNSFRPGKLKIIINKDGVLNITGDLILSDSGSYVRNNGVINSKSNIILGTGGVLENKFIMNCNTVQNNGATVTGSGTANTK